MDENIKKSLKFRIKRAHYKNYDHNKPNPDLFKYVPKQINNMNQVETTIHSVIKNIYRHIFAGGTVDQINQEDMVILILNPRVTKGIFRRKSYGSLYDRSIVYFNKVTGDLTLKEPSHWGHLDICEVEEKLNEIEQNKL